MNGAHTPLATDFGIEYAICKEMGWSVADMYAAPARMIDEILVRINAENKWTAKRAQNDVQKRNQRPTGKR